ncbi:unnamed protein product [Heligmosomoides polygyrus]|uniref:Homeobox domain-containing protein n=1 Tax=Heligmosomoides polygyrus TaxID=6339 RepID=A0A183GJ11_HELPZ|nr:unnamed protein product [Heligmosomoides polygyrus]
MPSIPSNFTRANGEERTLQFPMKLDLERPKRPRTTFSEDQLRLLEEAFQENGYLTGEARMALAARLALSDTQVSDGRILQLTQSRSGLSKISSSTITVLVCFRFCAGQSSHRV